MENSSLWYHFNEKRGLRAECLYCNAIIRTARGNVSNLKRHLQKKHPTVPLERTESPRSRSSSQSSQPVRRTTSTDSAESFLASATGSELEQDVDQTNDLLSCPSGSGQFKPFNQTSLTSFANLDDPLPVSKSEQIDSQLLKMVCEEYHPFSIVEGKEFRKLVSLLCPSYHLPSKETLSNSLLPQSANRLRHELKGKLNSTTAVALTTDSWTYVNNLSFIAITAHYFDGDAKLCSSLLGTLEFSSRHTAENLADFLKIETSYWEIYDKIVAVVTDNTPNIVAAVELCKWTHIPCYAHTINLIVKSGISLIEDVVDKIKSIVQFFKSEFALKKLKETQEQMKMPLVNLKQEVPTWGISLFDMLVRVFENKEPIISTLAILENNDHKLTTEEWDIVKYSIQLLGIFHKITKEVSDEQSITLSKADVLTCHILAKFLIKFKNQEGLPSVMVHVTETMLKAVEDQFSDVVGVIGQATLLDPRFKKFGFFEDNTKYAQAYDGVVNEVVQTLSQEKGNEHASSSSSYEYDMDLWGDFLKEVAEIARSFDPKVAAVRNLDNYIGAERLQITEDPMLWWDQNKSCRPHLYSLALKRLCIPASSVPSKRIFSKADKTLTEKMSRLGPSKIADLIFIHGNL